MRTVLLAVAIGVAISLLANLATTVYLHRALAHRALTLRPPAEHVFRFVIWTTTGIRPRQWVAVHRKHHAFTDVEGDPHSPVLHGWIKVQVMNVAMYRREARNQRTIERYARDLPATRLDRWFYDHALAGLGIGVVALCTVVGWQVGLMAAFVHVNVYLAGSAAVNAIGHHFGRRPYDNNAGNLQWLAFVTAGEGLHNNHHAKPTSAKLAHRWFEIDPGWWLIKTLTWLRLARLRVLSSTGAARGRGDALPTEGCQCDASVMLAPFGHATRGRSLLLAQTRHPAQTYLRRSCSYRACSSSVQLIRLSRKAST